MSRLVGDERASECFRGCSPHHPMVSDARVREGSKLDHSIQEAQTCMLRERAEFKQLVHVSCPSHVHDMFHLNQMRTHKEMKGRT